MYGKIHRNTKGKINVLFIKNLFSVGSDLLIDVFTLLRREYSKTCVKRPLSKRPKIGFQDQLLINAGQRYCRMPLCNTFDLH